MVLFHIKCPDCYKKYICVLGSKDAMDLEVSEQKACLYNGTMTYELTLQLCWVLQCKSPDRLVITKMAFYFWRQYVFPLWEAMRVAPYFSEALFNWESQMALFLLLWGFELQLRDFPQWFPHCEKCSHVEFLQTEETKHLHLVTGSLLPKFNFSTCLKKLNVIAFFTLHPTDICIFEL